MQTAATKAQRRLRPSERLALAKERGYLTNGESGLDGDWFRWCEAEAKPYARIRGTEFEIDLIGQPYRMVWSDEQLDALWESLKPYLTHGGKHPSKLHLGGTVLRLENVPPEHSDEVARICLATVPAWFVERDAMSSYRRVSLSLATPKPPKTFTEWLSRQRDRQDPVGDIANEVERDRCWPRRGATLATFRKHLELYHHAPDEAIEALEDAWQAYRAAREAGS